MGLVPAVVGHDHLHQDVAGEKLALYLSLLVVLDLSDHLGGDLDLMDEVMELAVFHRVDDAVRHLVLVPGIGVDHVPFCFVCHFSHSLLAADDALFLRP